MLIFNNSAGPDIYMVTYSTISNDRGAGKQFYIRADDRVDDSTFRQMKTAYRTILVK